MEFKRILESESLNEMATCFTDNSTSIFVNPVDSGNYAYFKYCNTKGFKTDSAIARISLLKPEYYHNHKDNHPELLLTSKAKRELIEKLKMPSKKYKGLTVFQSVIVDFNIEKYNVYFDETKEIKDYVFGNPLPLDLEIPDYTLLPSVSDAAKLIKNKRVETI